MTNENTLSRFDSFLSDEGPAAVVLIEQLEPIADGETVIFPPTYAPEQGVSNRKSEYVIDELKDGRKLCQIDSVGSQANRMEPVFKQGEYAKLVPQVTIEVAGGKTVSLLDAGHRAADAIVRFSDLGQQLADAFDTWQKGDASKLAVIAPTSLIFGAWDSRGTQAKTPRLVSSVIRAHDVEPVTRSAQYIPPLEYTPEVLGDAASLTDDQKSEFGLTHVPAPRALGGVIARGEIRREATLNLVALRAIGVPDKDRTIDETKTTAVRRYILGLCLAVLTKPMAHNLRQGCLLVGKEKQPADWKLVHPTGKREPFVLKHDEALAFAQQAAKKFREEFELSSGEGESFVPMIAKFDPKLAKAAADAKAKQKEAKKAGKNAGK